VLLGSIFFLALELAEQWNKINKSQVGLLGTEIMSLGAGGAPGGTQTHYI
jgi:hypothetical protein